MRSQAEMELVRVELAPWRPDDHAIYAYLLGLYLGDGHIDIRAPGRVLRRVDLDASYPAIIESFAGAMVRTSDRAVQTLVESRRHNVRIVQCAGKRWPEVFPHRIERASRSWKSSSVRRRERRAQHAWTHDRCSDAPSAG